MQRVIATTLMAVSLVGCASTETGIVPVGDGTYMNSGMGSFTTFTSARVKADLYKESSGFCEQQGKKIVPISSGGRDSGIGTYATGEIRFSCE